MSREKKRKMVNVWVWPLVSWLLFIVVELPRFTDFARDAFEAVFAAAFVGLPMVPIGALVLRLFRRWQLHPALDAAIGLLAPWIAPLLAYWYLTHLP